MSSRGIRVIGQPLPGVTVEERERVPWVAQARQWPRRARGAIGRWLLYRLRLAKIVPLVYRDQVVNQEFTISRSPRYVIISMGGRSYYFDPLTGELDGTGSLLCGG